MGDFIQPNDTMIYVYRLPPRLADGYCFQGGVPIVFENVDWFNGFDGMTREHLEKEVSKKNYVKPGLTFLVLSPDNDMAFTFQGKAPTND